MLLQEAIYEESLFSSIEDLMEGNGSSYNLIECISLIESYNSFDIEENGLEDLYERVNIEVEIDYKKSHHEFDKIEYDEIILYEEVRTALRGLDRMVTTIMGFIRKIGELISIAIMSIRNGLKKHITKNISERWKENKDTILTNYKNVINISMRSRTYTGSHNNIYNSYYINGQSITMPHILNDLLADMEKQINDLYQKMVEGSKQKISNMFLDVKYVQPYRDRLMRNFNTYMNRTKLEIGKGILKGLIDKAVDMSLTIAHEDKYLGKWTSNINPINIMLKGARMLFNVNKPKELAAAVITGNNKGSDGTKRKERSVEEVFGTKPNSKFMDALDKGPMILNKAMNNIIINSKHFNTLRQQIKRFSLDFDAKVKNTAIHKRVKKILYRQSKSFYRFSLGIIKCYKDIIDMEIKLMFEFYNMVLKADKIAKLALKE